MTAWARDLEARLPAEDREHRAMVFYLRAYAAFPVGERDVLDVCSAQASELAGPHRWVDAGAQYPQALSWSMIDPQKGQRHLERAMEIEASLGESPDPLDYVVLYCLRLLQAGSREEALALLADWIEDLGDSTPPPHMAGVFALYSDTQTALELKARYPNAVTPVGRLYAELSDTLVASALGRFEDAERHLAALASVVREFAVLHGEAACLIGFAKVALDRGDYARASRLLTAADSSKRTNPVTALVSAHCTRLLKDVLDPESVRTAQAEGAALSIKEALDTELSATG